jgi:hypothetical protein
LTASTSMTMVSSSIILGSGTSSSIGVMPAHWT